VEHKNRYFEKCFDVVLSIKLMSMQSNAVWAATLFKISSLVKEMHQNITF